MRTAVGGHLQACRSPSSRRAIYIGTHDAAVMLLQGMYCLVNMCLEGACTCTCRSSRGGRHMIVQVCSTNNIVLLLLKVFR